MKEINYNVRKILTKSKTFELGFMADTHIGNAGTDEDFIKSNIREFKKRGIPWIHMGDWSDAIGPKDKRYDVRTCKDPILEQYERCYELFEPIQNNGIVLLTGNHDEKIAKEHGDYVKQLAKRLNIPYGGYCAIVNLRFWFQKRKNPNLIYRIFLHHGYGGGRKPGSKVNNISDIAGGFEADLYVIGHVHNLNWNKDIYLQSGKDSRKKRSFLILPGYIDGYQKSDTATYVEKHLFKSQVIGCVILKFYRNGNKINVIMEDITK